MRARASSSRHEKVSVGGADGQDRSIASAQKIPFSEDETHEIHTQQYEWLSE
jgi:hypothetical protein